MGLQSNQFDDFDQKPNNKLNEVGIANVLKMGKLLTSLHCGPNRISKVQCTYMKILTQHAIDLPLP